MIQTFGRAARHVNGTVILYADTETASMRKAIDETDRRRSIQCDFNTKNGILPQSIQKGITTIFNMAYENAVDTPSEAGEAVTDYLPEEALEQTIERLEKEMRRAARDLEFEQAAELRDRIKALKSKIIFES